MRDFGCNFKEVIVCEEEWLRRAIILNEIAAFFMTVFPPSAEIEKQVEVDALNKGDRGL